MPIGLMGGTFDPIHNGHLITAEKIREVFKLDAIYIIPCFIPPHKGQGDIISALHRYVMAVLATLDKDGLIASPIELLRGKRSYTIDTIKQFRAVLSSEEKIFFITGIDSFFTIKTWKQWRKLLDSCHFIINSRPGYSFDELNNFLPASGREKIVDLRGNVKLNRALLSEKQKQKGNYFIFLIDTPPVDISATEIREMIKRGERFEDMLPLPVAKYIKKNRLYLS